MGAVLKVSIDKKVIPRISYCQEIQRQSKNKPCVNKEYTIHFSMLWHIKDSIGRKNYLVLSPNSSCVQNVAFQMKMYGYKSFVQTFLSYRLPNHTEYVKQLADMISTNFPSSQQRCCISMMVTRAFADTCIGKETYISGSFVTPLGQSTWRGVISPRSRELSPIT